MRSRLSVRALFTAAFAVTLSACGGAPPAAPASPSLAAASSSGTSSASAPATTGSAATKPAPSSASAKPALGASGAAAPAGGPIKIGLVEPLTGSLAQVAKDNQDGFNLYLESINNIIVGRQIQVITADDNNQADVALTKAKALVESDKVNVLMGIQATPVCYAIAGYVKDAQIPTIVTGNCGAENATSDPKYKSPYFVRFTQNTSGLFGPAGDWAAKQSFKKADILTSDYGGGLEVNDVTASTFVLNGGSIVQELHPPLGTNDFGPYLAKLDQTADALFFFAPGTDALRFGEQFGNYVTNKKLQIIDNGSTLTHGAVLAQLKEKLLGVVSAGIYSDALDTPASRALQQAFKAKYPGRQISYDVAQGYSGAQVLEAALKKVNGNVEDKQGFLNSLYSVNTETVKGPQKLDADHDVIQNIYFYQIVKSGNDLGHKLLQTYSDVARGYQRQPGLPAPGTLKDKWVGMTKDKLLAAK